MSDPRSLLERETRRFTQADGAFERLVQRRDRKRRNQRIAAGSVGIAVFVAAVLIVTTAGSLDRTRTPGGSGTTGPAQTGPAVNGPYTEPTYTLGPVSQHDIAVGESFMDAWADGDGDAAAALFDPEGTFDGFQPSILPALHDWFRAEGWTFGASGGCGIHGYDAQRGVVGCGFDYENDLTRGFGLPPVGNSLSFVVGAAGIDTAWFGSGGDAEFDMLAGFRGEEDVLGPVWDMFIDWISSSHPEDLVRMYDADHDYPVLDPTSIELWTRYTGEFLASPPAQELARSIRDAGWDGVGFPPDGTAPSTPVEGEVVGGYDAVLGPNFAFVYADGRVIAADGLTNYWYERRLKPEGVELVRSGAVEAERFVLSSSPVPADAWEDAEIKPYVPSRYAVCFYQESGDANPGTINQGYEYPSRVLSFFPPRAQDILRGKDHTYDRDTTSPQGVECSELTIDEARALDAILSDLSVEDAEGDQIFWEVNTLLPHGEWVGQAG